MIFRIGLVFAVMLSASMHLHAGSIDGNAVIGGALGGATGAAVGSAVGGKNGAIIGAGIGGATGAALMASESKDKHDDHYHHDNGLHRGHDKQKKKNKHDH